MLSTRARWRGKKSIFFYERAFFSSRSSAPRCSFSLPGDTIASSLRFSPTVPSSELEAAPAPARDDDDDEDEDEDDDDEDEDEDDADDEEEEAESVERMSLVARRVDSPRLTLDVIEVCACARERGAAEGDKRSMRIQQSARDCLLMSQRCVCVCACV